jgi:hypothetical protein
MEINVEQTQTRPWEANISWAIQEIHMLYRAWMIITLCKSESLVSLYRAT